MNDAYLATLRGSLEAPPPSGRGARSLVAAARHLARPSTEPPLAIDAVGGLDAAERPLAARACGLAARGAILALDRPSAEAWIARGYALVGPDAREAPELELERAHLALWIGEGGVDHDLLVRRLRAAAAIAPQAGIDGVSLRALAELSRGDADAALASARRASRMARTEAFSQSEYFANVALARVRRLRGHPHLASRITSALLDLSPPSWHAWVGWEHAMAGASRALDLGADPFGACTAALRGFLRADGDRTSLAAHTQHASLLRADVQRLLAATDPRLAPAQVDDAGSRRWASGEEPQIPYGLHALTSEEPALGSYACAAAGFGAPPRRILGVAARRHVGDGARLVVAGQRIDTALSVLLLAGDAGLPLEVFFQRVYGFAYVPALHRSARNVLVHRVREELGDAATVDRDDETIGVTAHRPLLVADGRCARSLEDRLLAFIAAHPGVSAKALAEIAGVPLRTTQVALRTLVDDESCVLQAREGRRVVYTVEDTTFSEPTRG